MRRRSFLFAPFAPVALAAAGRPVNVMLVIASGWRAQAVPWERDPDLSAPNLARFGGESVTFPHAYSGYPRSIQARRVLLNSYFYHERSRQDVGVEDALLGVWLNAAGYRVAAFGDGKVDEIAAFVHSSGSQPFYVEWTLAAGRGFSERSNAADLHIRPNVSSAYETTARDELARFYARCTARDRDLGVVLSALDQPELKDDTVVVFTSDRGNQFGSHAIAGDDSFYEESVRIPLAMRHPRLAPGARDMLISQADLAPTLLGLCGVPAPEDLRGRNLTPLIAEHKGELPDAVFAEGRIGEADEWRMLVRGYDKLVTDTDGRPTHLFNLAEDPYEMNNRVNVSADELKRDALGALMQFWRRKLGDGRDASGLKPR